MLVVSESEFICNVAYSIVIQLPWKSSREIKWEWDKINLDYLQNYKWPKDFHWGVATAAHQGTCYSRLLTSV